MATEEHKNLASFIRGVHKELRNKAKKIGADEAWKHHCSQLTVLDTYAQNMKFLATQYWDHNNYSSEKPESRIDWINKFSTNYFICGLKHVERHKEQFAISRSCAQSNSEKVEEISENCAVERNCEEPLRLLDVGSCYSPFKIFPIFDILAIDIAPAVDDVIKCDFLNINILNSTDLKNLWTKSYPKTNISEFPCSFFDIVVFSLLLEYLPSPQQRYICCENAYNVLKSEGLLFIITPDSKHPTANASIMKKWRIALALIGFKRVSYEKLPHLHCMAYRKNINKDSSFKWAYSAAKKLNVVLDYIPSFMVIPQDSQFNDASDSDPNDYVFDRTTEENSNLVSLFSELPYT